MQTLEEIRREGLAALRERLGETGMVRFLQQFETGSGDYATEPKVGGRNIAGRHSSRRG